METKGTERDLDGIVQYITDLKFKPAVVGGVDKGEVLLSIKEIYDSFSKLHNEALARMEASEEQLAQKDEELEQQRKDFAAREFKLRENIHRELSEVIEQRWSKQATELETELGAQRNETELCRSELEQQSAKFRSQYAELQDKLMTSERERIQREENHLRELELARAGAAAKGETLEEIYLEAREQRAGAIARAQQEVQEILKHATQEAEDIVAEQQSMVDDARKLAQEQADEILAEAEVTKQAAQSALAEQEARCRDLQEQAQLVLENAETEAKRIIDSAKEGYQRECEKYSAQILSLSDLRSKAVLSMQDTINKMHNLAFEMSSNGIRSDAENLHGLHEAEFLLAQQEEEEVAAPLELLPELPEAEPETETEPETL